MRQICYPDYVLVIDPALAFTDNITNNDKPTTSISCDNSHEEGWVDISNVQSFRITRIAVFVVDCIEISLDTIGRAIPNAPMLGALMKVSDMFELDFFLDSMKKVTL